MPEPVNARSYSSASRSAQAAATRERILNAAAELFLERGYARTSTLAIGRAAGVSEASVFANWRTKAELLVAVVTDRVGRHPDFPLRRNAALTRLRGEGDREATLRTVARIVRKAHDRSWRLLAVAVSAAEEDESVRAAVARGAQSRHDDCRWIAAELLGAPRPSLGPTTDAIWALIAVENYRHLVVDRGWTPARYERWLVTMLAAAAAPHS